VSRLARVKSVYKGYSSAREAVLLNGRFILSQLQAADDARRGITAGAKDKGKSAAGASEWAFCKGLEAEVRARGHQAAHGAARTPACRMHHWGLRCTACAPMRLLSSLKPHPAGLPPAPRSSPRAPSRWAR
jgi:hypothetical protein